MSTMMLTAELLSQLFRHDREGRPKSFSQWTPFQEGQAGQWLPVAPAVIIVLCTGLPKVLSASVGICWNRGGREVRRSPQGRLALESP